MNSKVRDICTQYLNGTIDIDSAASAIAAESGWGYISSAPDASPDDEERLLNLFARVLWLTIGDSSGGEISDTPFTATDLRQMASGTFFDEESEESAEHDEGMPTEG